MLPLSLPGIVTAAIFAFIAAWNEYIVALTLMTDPAMKPLTVGITSYVTAYVQHWNSLFAASVDRHRPGGRALRAGRALPGRRTDGRQPEVGEPAPLTLPSPQRGEG